MKAIILASLFFMAFQGHANATGIQYDLKGKVVIMKETSSTGIEIEYNTRHPNKTACETNKMQIVQTPIELHSAKTFYRGHQGLFGVNLDLELNAMQDQTLEYFRETSIGAYESATKVVHLGCYPVNVVQY